MMLKCPKTHMVGGSCDCGWSGWGEKVEEERDALRAELSSCREDFARRLDEARMEGYQNGWDAAIEQVKRSLPNRAITWSKAEAPTLTVKSQALYSKILPTLEQDDDSK